MIDILELLCCMVLLADTDHASMYKSITPRCMKMSFEKEYKTRLSDTSVSFFEATAETRVCILIAACCAICGFVSG